MAPRNRSRSRFHGNSAPDGILKGWSFRSIDRRAPQLMQKNNPDPISLTGDPVATRGTLAAAGIVTAIALGLAIGSGNLMLGAALLLASLGLIYMLFVRHNTWQLALLICYLQFAIEPGFKMGPTALNGAREMGLVLIQLWYKRPPVYAPFF